MKNPTPAGFTTVAITTMLLGCLTGCESTQRQSRIQENASLVNQLPAEVREEVARGAIAKGYTPDMVFLALGRPDDIESAADGQDFVWIYRKFYPSAEVVPDSLYAPKYPDPLGEVAEAWRHNQSHFDQKSMPEHLRKRADQTWSQYAKQNPSHPNLENPSAVAVAANNHRMIHNEPGVRPQIEPMRLEVIFKRQVVADALVNDTVSVFVPPR